MNVTQPIVSAFQPSLSANSFRLERIMLAHDGSKAARQALLDAITLARQFQSEILLVRVQSPEEIPLNSRAHSYHEQQYAKTELDEIKGQLAQAGLRCRTIVRMGAVADTIANLCTEERADLVMIGAYGYGSQDRHTLGSTTEHLLSALPCSAMVYGPSVKLPLAFEEHNRPVLFAVLFPVTPNQSEKASQIAQFFDVSLEVFHVVPMAAPVDLQSVEKECKQIAARLQRGGIQATWSVISGVPAKMILRESTRLSSPFVLLPVKYRHIMAADRVAAHVIRTSDVPVFTYSIQE